ncbi:HIT family protein [Gordonia sp. HY442]|uniref:HIT family protein n=1 Tax=Gordonia zhenghanii TaxID=2911516 RepID=UPI001F1C2371|nr:HIT family protein [Gordonia zhenghanii]MCF8604111.1 HIT family protein [Gordonia zhenghanii]
MTHDACVFCDIVAERGPAHVVYSDDDVVAFLDRAPVARGHTLVVPRTHSSGLADLDPSFGTPLLSAAQRIANALKGSEFGADGVNLALNDGRAAMQTVFHTHVHVVPRRSGDKLTFAKGFLTRRPGDLESTAAQLRTAIAAQE